MSEFNHLIDLAGVRYGGSVVAANDEFFAPKENLLKPEAPVFVPDKYTDRGKWMDGWETRRRRTPGYDWCIVRLGLPGIVKSLVVDTSFFRGNHPAQCSIEGCALGPYADDEGLVSVQSRWWPLLPPSDLRGDAQNVFAILDGRRCTHLRLNIHPDGGVARLRVMGEALPDLGRLIAAGGEIDLAAAPTGACVVAASDRFFGDPQNMLRPGPAEHMGDGWETRRRRGPGHDWAVVRLGVEGAIRRIEVDTAHFRGNYPDRCSIEAARLDDPRSNADLDGVPWVPLLQETRLRPDQPHVFERELSPDVVATHVRLNIYPDGGISRFRVFGDPTAHGRTSARLRLLNAMDEQDARAALVDCCAAPAWVERLVKARPFRTKVELAAAASLSSDALGPSDWLEAIRHHPRLGEQRPELPTSGTSQAWSAAEQSGIAGADRAALSELAQLNRAYEDRFGYVFLVCADGRRLPEILDALRGRLTNEPEAELPIAAAELRRIAQLRLEKLLS
jgi:allantoicase